MKRLYCLIALSLFISNFVVAQEKEKKPDAEEQDEDGFASKVFSKKHNPTKAAVFSAVIPGLGQAYNGKYWKMPIIYLAKGYLIYELVDSHREYVSYRDVLYNRQAGELAPEDDPYPTFSDADLRQRKNTFRSSRDDFIIYVSLAYIMQIIDAAVDAHLQGFKVGEEMILSFEPNFSTFAHGGRGLTLNLTF